ncbi:hypothetical protein M8C21_024163 [Ambrosia artemisiifolia]|uniref:Uncharacterized protein n=1 Tax=Ambrosia artemisiifolia TaxID=4212 RepID=A0AAD5BZZ9_AMBAR|nr:hypothetical protein M8C21_024163 [Ambrosia artemisiifolia]
MRRFNHSSVYGSAEYYVKKPQASNLLSLIVKKMSDASGMMVNIEAIQSLIIAGCEMLPVNSSSFTQV